jgi:hypothetical protein
MRRDGTACHNKGVERMITADTEAAGSPGARRIATRIGIAAWNTRGGRMAKVGRRCCESPQTKDPGGRAPAQDSREIESDSSSPARYLGYCDNFAAITGQVDGVRGVNRRARQPANSLVSVTARGRGRRARRSRRSESPGRSKQKMTFMHGPAEMRAVGSVLVDFGSRLNGLVPRWRAATVDLSPVRSTSGGQFVTARRNVRAIAPSGPLWLTARQAVGRVPPIGFRPIRRE